MTDYEPKYLKLWTMPRDYAGAVWPGYYSAGVGQSRDSDDLEASNFAMMLKDLGGESDTVIVVHEGHWAVGWVEWIAIHKDDGRALEIADNNVAALADYPVLDEEDFSRREQESADHVWRDCYSVDERIKYIRENDSQFDWHNWADMRACVRGDYFKGYASDLLA